MAHILADRVLETTTTTGTGNIALAAAVLGFRRFSTACAVNDTVPYFIEAIDSLGVSTGDYEWGIGTYSSANTLTRTTVLGSSNAGLAVNFSAGSKNVGIGLQATGFGASLAGNGYQKFPSGVILQWGAATATVAGTAVSFPIPFPTGVVNISATNIATVSGAAVSVFGGSPSGFTLYGNSTTGAFWTALGY